MIFAAREYPSSKNHETPFREEIEDIDLRRFAQIELFYYSSFRQRTVAEFLCGGISDTEKYRNMFSLSFLP
jgi:hypothetical protein